MGIKLTEKSLFDLLAEKNLAPVVEKESGQTYFTMRINMFEVPVFCGVRGEGTLIQTIAYLPYELNEKALGEAARILHLLNRESDIPGFGMDEKIKVMFFRCVFPCMNGELEPKLLELYLGATKLACQTFMESIGMVASGRATMDQVMKRKL